ncbi:beta-carotene 15,15'-monooxygenase [Olivibacter sp. SDN3]|uniref:DUF6427 family protein n=1 Tax=Olivibacter sp. SDN3 TaxID=2764720 RepID=UPI0016518663|nr:DUF6427 family protein [Olivibacter sp. SDN3]QNL51220.1 beta-carotene 15,15'-monooxygenase [Olivibacter sp. SDN3]
MINLFRKFTPANLAFLIAIAVILCIGAFIHLPRAFHPLLFEPSISSLLDNFDDFTLTPKSNVIITLVITIGQALFLNRIVDNHNLLGKPTFLPALMYVTTASLLLPFLALTPTLICNFFLIWMIDKLLKTYHRKEVKSTLFDLGMLVAVGTLFYFPFIVMFPLLWIALIIFRPFDWREWVAGLLGFVVIYFLLGIIYLWNDQLAAYYAIWKPLTHAFPTSFNIDLYDYWVLLPLALVLILFLNTLRENFYKSIVHVRKSFQLLFFMFLFGAASFYLKADTPDFHFLLCAPPISIYMAYYFNFAKLRWFYEGVYTILLLTILYFQLF